MTLPAFMVKVCGITRRADAVAAAEAGASAIGFVFHAASPRNIAPERAAEAGAGLNVLRVGVFVNQPAAAIAATMRAAHLDVAQIYGGDAPGGARVWRAFRVDGSFDLSSIAPAEAVLLDGSSSGHSFDWSVARDLGQRDPAIRVIVAGGLDASNVAEAIRGARPWGVDASSRLETSPGVKDCDKIRRFVEAALHAAAKNLEPSHTKAGR